MGKIIARFIQNVETLDVVRKQLHEVVQYYPEFNKWWDVKIISEITNGRRMVCAAYYNGILAGIMVLKNAEEKKICTLYVLPEYRGQGIGTFLVRLAIQTLGTTKPIITVPEPVYDCFDIFLGSFGFRESARYPDYYVEGVTEIVYNGYLPPK